MFKKETEYALRGLVYIQSQNLKGIKPGVSEISREVEAPQFYTGKILQKLVRQGFLESAKGKGGGFYFDNAKANLPLKTVIQAIEGDKSIAGCGFGLKYCDENKPCALHEQYSPIRESINRLISINTVQSIALNFQKGEINFLNRLNGK